MLRLFYKEGGGHMLTQKDKDKYFEVLMALGGYNTSGQRAAEGDKKAADDRDINNSMGCYYSRDREASGAV